MPTDVQLANLIENIGDNVRTTRKSLGITQVRLADRTGIKQASIARVESGRHVPTLLTLIRIADALETDIHSLMADREATPA